MKILDDTWLSIVPVIANPDIDLFEILRFLVHFGLQQLLVHVHTVDVFVTFEGLRQSEVNPFVESKNWTPEIPIAVTIDSIGDRYFLVQGEESRNTFTPSSVSTCGHVQDARPSSDPFGRFEVEGHFVELW